PTMPRSTSDWYRARQRRRAGPETPGSTTWASLTFAHVADADRLLEAYAELREHGGPAPGRDGLTYADLRRSEVAMMLRAVASALKDCSYRPQPARYVRIRKPSGGQRTLTLRSLCDRVVAATLSRLLTPLWEKVFLDGSWGFRPGRNTWGLLAR